MRQRFAIELNFLTLWGKYFLVFRVILVALFQACLDYLFYVFQNRNSERKSVKLHVLLSMPY